MKVAGFILLCAVSGGVFFLIQEFKWKRWVIGKNYSENAITSYDAVMSVLMNLLAIAVVMGMLIIYGRVFCYRPSSSVAVIGFIVLGVSHKVFKKFKKKGNV
jgi:hypothetical protein